MVSACSSTSTAPAAQFQLHPLSQELLAKETPGVIEIGSSQNGVVTKEHVMELLTDYEKKSRTIYLFHIHPRPIQQCKNPP